MCPKSSKSLFSGSLSWPISVWSKSVTTSTRLLRILQTGGEKSQAKHPKLSEFHWMSRLFCLQTASLKDSWFWITRHWTCFSFQSAPSKMSVSEGVIASFLGSQKMIRHPKSTFEPSLRWSWDEIFKLLIFCNHGIFWCPSNLDQTSWNGKSTAANFEMLPGDSDLVVLLAVPIGRIIPMLFLHVAHHKLQAICLSRCQVFISWINISEKKRLDPSKT